MNALAVAWDHINRAATQLAGVAGRIANLSDPKDSLGLSPRLAVLPAASGANQNLVDLSA